MGCELEFRQHVQHGRRRAVPAVPADAADPDPAEQPASTTFRRSRSRSIRSIRRVVAGPVKWDIKLIERFMLVFGPVSSIFDFLTFYALLVFFGAGEALFQTGWFIELMTTQILVVFCIRTRRRFYRSRPAGFLVAMALGVVAVAIALPLLSVVAGSGLWPRRRCSSFSWSARHWHILRSWRSPSAFSTASWLHNHLVSEQSLTPPSRTTLRRLRHPWRVHPRT